MAEPADRLALNREIIEAFRANNGRVTHPMIPESIQLTVLTTTGARTNLHRTSVVAYFNNGSNSVVVIASAYGAAAHPAWYHNLVANHRVTIELPTDSGDLAHLDAKARTAQGTERDRLIAAMATEAPIMAEFTKNAHREVPVVVLEY